MASKKRQQNDKDSSASMLNLSPSANLLAELSGKAPAQDQTPAPPDSPDPPDALATADEVPEADEVDAVSMQDPDLADVALEETVQPAGPKASKPGRVEPNSLLRPMRILVVDDHEPLRRLLVRFLTLAGAMTSEAGDGAEAIKAVHDANLAGCSFDVILLDMMMPVLDGPSTAKTLRAMGNRSRIVAMTANESRYDRDKCLDAGCDMFARKPIQVSELVEMLRPPADEAGDDGSADATDTH